MPGSAEGARLDGAGSPIFFRNVSSSNLAPGPAPGHARKTLPGAVCGAGHDDRQHDRHQHIFDTTTGRHGRQHLRKNSTFGSITPGANACAQVDIDTDALATSPHKLTLMLFDAALLALSIAQQHMNANETENKGNAISHAITLIDSGLRASLNKEAGGAIADNLDALYGYMCQQLLSANLKNQPELLVEVHGLLTDLRATWKAIDPAAQATGVAVAPVATPVATSVSIAVTAAVTAAVSAAVTTAVAAAVAAERQWQPS